MGLKQNLRSKHPEISVRRLKSQFRFKFCGLDPSLFHIFWNRRLGFFHFLLEKRGFLTGSLKKKRFSFSYICREPKICWFPSYRRKGTVFILYIEPKKHLFLLFWGSRSNGECNTLEKMKTVYGKSFWREAEENSRENLLNVRTDWSLVSVHDKEESQTTYTVWKVLQCFGSSICIWWNRGREITPNLNITQWKCKHIILIK